MPKPDSEVAARIQAAAQRLLSGEALLDLERSAPAQLATEAGVNRTRLYDTYPDLLADFTRQVEQRQVEPPAATPREQALIERVNALESDRRDLKERLAQANSEIDNRKRANEQFMRIINLVEREKQILEGRLSDARLRQRTDADTITALREQIMDMTGAQTPHGVTPLRPLGSTPEDR